jgi:hypothetical protein
MVTLGFGGGQAAGRFARLPVDGRLWSEFVINMTVFWGDTDTTYGEILKTL